MLKKNKWKDHIKELQKKTGKYEIRDSKQVFIFLYALQ